MISFKGGGRGEPKIAKVNQVYYTKQKRKNLTEWYESSSY